jgi:hypothetical protein
VHISSLTLLFFGSSI